MKALTVRHPWALLIAQGVKTVENRVQGTTYRGPLAIHVSQRWDYEAFDQPRVIKALGLDPDSWSGVRARLERVGDVHDDMTRTAGHVIAITELGDVHPASGDCCVPWGDYQSWPPCMSDPPRTLRHLVLTNARRLERPIPAKGRLGLWDLDDALLTDGLSA